MRGRFTYHVVLTVLLICQFSICLATEIPDTNNTSIYYVAPDGNDMNPGNLKQPFKTLQKAIEVVKPGEAIFVRGGIYYCDKTIIFDKSGEEDKPIRVWAYENEKPLFDFSMGQGEGFLIKAAYWHLKGLSVTGAELPGISLKSIHAHHNIVEYVTTYGNELSGVWLKSGAAYNLILNCDSHHNFDPATNGQNADGFAASSGVGPGNIFRGCRAWKNADDGFDFFRLIGSVRAESCFAWRNGQNVWGHPLWEGNSNGFKIWKVDSEHVLVRCVAWDHAYRGVKGPGIIHNCTVFHNLAGYSAHMSMSTADRNVRNNISWPRSSPIRSQLRGVHNSWNKATGMNLTLDDFLSTDDSVITGPRNPDGSLPASDFLKLAPGSDAIDAGIDVGLPYIGKAPDLGAFEYTSGNGDTDRSRVSKENYDEHETKVTHVDPRLREAAEKGELDTIKRLIVESGTKDRDLTALFYIAIARGHLDAVKYLIASSTDVNSDAPTPVPSKGENYKELCGRLRLDKIQDNKYRWTPLHAAVSGGYPEIVEYLIAKKADINPRDDLEWTPLHVAAWQSPDVIPILITHGADVHAQDFRGWTALHHAAEQGHLNGVKSLVTKGANVHTADNYGSRPLHCAACEGHTDIVEMLIARGAMVNSIDNAGRSPLYYAARWGHENVVVFLVSKGANPNIADKWGWTPVHIASLHVQKEAIQGLLTEKTDLTLKNNRGRTAMSIAGWRCKELYERFTDPAYIEYLPQAKIVFDLLIKHGAKFEAGQEESQTKSIHQAAGEGDAEYLKILLSEGKGTDVNSQDDTGLYTALHVGAMAGHKVVIELLIENGADVNAKDNKGRTSLWHAQEKGYTEIVELLRQHGAK